jgi:hypothetical protein
MCLTSAPDRGKRVRETGPLKNLDELLFLGKATRRDEFAVSWMT